MIWDSALKEKNTTNNHDFIDDDNVYMNETISSGIPLEKLDTTVLKQGTMTKKEFAVSSFSIYNYNYIFLIQIHI